MNILLLSLVTGLIATMITDLWGYLRKPLLGMPAADYRLVGRWVLHMARGRFQHESIAASPAMRGEEVAGWLAHYLLGLAFAAVMLAIAGEGWLRRPSLAPALAFGLTTVLLPFLVMQPAMGMGVAASRTSRPRSARIQGLVTHAVFGLGLYAGGWAANFLSTTGD
jgi:hypothetical protein